MKQLVIATVLASALAVNLGGCATSSHHGHLISDTTIEDIPVGSSKEHVELAIGTPSTLATFEERDVYYYISQTVYQRSFFAPRIIDQRVLAVYFDENEQVARHASYGLKDGKVFDFISRKTPSGGKDRSLIGQILSGIGRPQTQ